MFLWYALKKLGADGLKSRYQHSLKVAEYCEARLKDIGINAWRNPGAITVVLPKTSSAIKHKWQLATEGDVCHVICMPNVTISQIDEFIHDMTHLNEVVEEEFELEF